MTAEVLLVEDSTETPRQKWLRETVAKAPPWTPDRVARLAVALDYPERLTYHQTTSTEDSGRGA